jgi:hypothetical protein
VPTKQEPKSPASPKADPVAANVAKLAQKVNALEEELAALKVALSSQLNVTV